MGFTIAGLLQAAFQCVDQEIQAENSLATIVQYFSGKVCSILR